MALVAKALRLDITPGAIPQVVNVSEYDENREYTVTLIDEGGVFEIPSGTTATVEGSIGGNAFSESATVSGNTITFTLSESMTAKAGDVWCKIKLTKDSKPIQTCAFILRCDKAGVEADTVIGASGFEEQINQGVTDYLDDHQPFFTLPEGGQSGQALLSDGNNGANWGDVQSGGTGLTEDMKQALLECFENVAWINDDGQTYYDALYAALYPPADLVSIRAAFNQGSAVIYDTDSLDTLKQYLTVTATMSDSTTRTVTNYTLSGTLVAGTSTITVSYGGKTTTFNVTVTHESLLPDTYQQVEWIESSGGQKIDTGVNGTIRTNLPYYQLEADMAIPVANSSTAIIMSKGQQPGCWVGNVMSGTAVGLGAVEGQYLTGIDITSRNNYKLFWTGSGSNITATVQCGAQTVSKTVATTIDQNRPFTFFSDAVQDFPAKCRIYRAKVKEYDSYIRDLIPCYRKSDNVIGMYDIVNSTFYTNSGTGSFTKGSDV